MQSSRSSSAHTAYIVLFTQTLFSFLGFFHSLISDGYEIGSVYGDQAYQKGYLDVKKMAYRDYWLEAVDYMKDRKSVV